MNDIRDWAFGLLLVCASIVGLIEWNSPDVDYFWRSWAETGLRIASRADDGPQALQLAEWAFELREDSTDSRTVERLSSLLQENGRHRDRAALLSFEALRSRGDAGYRLATLAFESEPNVLTGWLVATSRIAADQAVPAEAETQISARQWQYADYYACHKRLKPSVGVFGRFTASLAGLGTAPAWKSPWADALKPNAPGLLPNPIASAQCVVERQNTMNDVGLKLAAETLLRTDKEASYWANGANAQAEVNRRAADRNAWTPLANQNKFGACVAGAFLPDAKDVAMYGAAAISKTVRRKVIPVLGALFGIADCGEAMNKIEEARKQVNLLNGEIQHISSGATLKAHRTSRAAAAKEYGAELKRRLTGQYYRFRADKVLAVFAGEPINDAFLR